MEVVDVHTHLWDKGGFNYDEPGQPYFGPQHLEELRGTRYRVTVSIHVECGMNYYRTGPEHLRPVGETEFVVRQANLAPDENIRIARGIVGCADFRFGAEIREVAEKHIEQGEGRFKGLRLRAAWDPDPSVAYSDTAYPDSNIIADEATIAAAKELAALGLRCMVWAFHTQIPSVGKLAAAVPSLPISLNHFGGPIGVGRYAENDEQVFADWKRDMAALTSHENIFMQIGGVGTSRMGFRRLLAEAPERGRELLYRYIEASLEIFGERRLMFSVIFQLIEIFVVMAIISL